MKLGKIIGSLLVLFFGMAILFSCKEKKNIPDVSKVEIPFHYQRFDLEVYEFMNRPFTAADLEKWKVEYPSFLNIYFRAITRIADVRDTHAVNDINKFTKDVDFKKIADTSILVYKHIDAELKSIENGWKFYKYYFPTEFTPNVIFYPFGFNYAAVAIDSAACIALDQYLGEDYVYYNHLPDYLRFRKTRAYIVPDLFKAWGSSQFDSGNPRISILDEIIFQGKILYFVDALLPTVNDSLKIGFTQQQMDFCKMNEYQIWSYLIEKKLLYTNDSKNINKYCGESPFTPGMPRDSPGRAAVWTGWQIVKKYMKENKDITLEMLMHEHDAQKILTLSKYKPKR